MKRSDANRLVALARRCFELHGWALPPVPRWDICDFGLGDVWSKGLLLVNLAEEPEYCEKLMYQRRGMVCLPHTHLKKKEDIICRWGRLQVTVWNGRPRGGDARYEMGDGESRECDTRYAIGDGGPRRDVGAGLQPAESDARYAMRDGESREGDARYAMGDGESRGDVGAELAPTGRGLQPAECDARYAMGDQDGAAAVFQLSVNGEPRAVKNGERLVLNAGERVTLVPGIYHAFEPLSEEVIIGEVSTANDDVNDNVFADEGIGRFPEIEEDEEPLVRLVFE